MGLLKVLASFRTKQALFKEYKKSATLFQTEKYWGEYNNKHNLEEVENILHLFQTQRDEHFEFIRQSDYRDTWRSKNLPTNYFIKEYRVFESKYRKILVYKKNILRRCLAKKSFVVNNQLQEFGIPTIENLCYAANNGSYISKSAFYISIAEKSAVTIKYYFINWLQKAESGGYKIEMVQNFPHLSTDEIFYKLGQLIKSMLDYGTRLPPKEYLSNVLIVPLDNDIKFGLKLCDPEGIDMILKYSKQEKIKQYMAIRDKIELTLNKLHVPHNIQQIDQGARFSRDKNNFLNKN